MLGLSLVERVAGWGIDGVGPVPMTSRPVAMAAGRAIRLPDRVGRAAI